MKSLPYTGKRLIFETIEGHFVYASEARVWATMMRRRHYEVSQPFKDIFAYSHEHPWRTTARRLQAWGR